MAERSKARVRSRSLAGVVGSNPAGGMDVCVVLYSNDKRQNPGQSGHRSKDKIQREQKNPCEEASFPHPSTPALGPTQTPIEWVPGVFPVGGVKWLGRGVKHPSPSSAEVKERVEVYLYSLSATSWPVLG